MNKNHGAFFARKLQLYQVLFLNVAIIFGLSACSVTSQTSGNDETSADWSHPVTSWGDPDLRGKWPLGHLISTPFQRPVSMGTRTSFTEEELAQRQASVDARNTRYDNEDESDKIGMGHWAEPSAMPTQTSLLVDPPNGRFPELTEAGKAKSLTMGSSWTNKTFDSVKDFDTWDRCITRGLPPSMFPFNYNNGIHILQSPGYVVIRLEMIHEARIVPIDGRGALSSDIKQWMGESRGYWEGDTLVVETSNFNGLSGMTNIGTPGSPRGNNPVSENMKLTERFERIGAGTMNYSMTVEDPEMITQSWTAAFPIYKDDSYEFFEYACHEDNYTIRNYIDTSRYQRENP